MARFPGHMIHLDVKKVGRIPPGGGWRAHGRGTPEAKASTTIGFFCCVRAFLAAHGVTRLVRVVTDNGANLPRPDLHRDNHLPGLTPPEDPSLHPTS